MRALLTPEIAPRLGVVLFRPGADVMPLFRAGKVIVETAPSTLTHSKSGLIPTPEQPLAENAGVRSYLTTPEVVKAAGGIQTLEQNLLVAEGCQWPHSDYHYHEFTTLRRGAGALRLCYGCDNKLRGHEDETQKAIADKNAVKFVISRIIADLRLGQHHKLNIHEVCWWAFKHGVLNLLPESAAGEGLGLPVESIGNGPLKESDIQPSVTASSVLQGKLAASPPARVVVGAFEQLEEQNPVIAIGIDPESPESFMRRPKRRRWEYVNYTRWVKAQPCECCRRPGDDPHHIIGYGQGGMGTKAHDLFVIPLCRACHDELHANVKAFEQKHGTQLELLFRFMDRAMAIGVITKGVMEK